MGITDPTEEYFKDGLWGWDGTRWRKLPIVWGLTERWAENLGGIKDGAGTYQVDCVDVPAGYIYVLQCAWITNDTAARGRANIWLKGGVDYASLACNATSARYIPLNFVGTICLAEGDDVRVYMESCVHGDDIKAGVWGYKMKVT